jgi:hypothetical protein
MSAGWLLRTARQCGCMLRNLSVKPVRAPVELGGASGMSFIRRARGAGLRSFNGRACTPFCQAAPSNCPSSRPGTGRVIIRLAPHGALSALGQTPNSRPRFTAHHPGCCLLPGQLVEDPSINPGAARWLPAGSRALPAGREPRVTCPIWRTAKEVPGTAALSTGGGAHTLSVSCARRATTAPAGRIRGQAGVRPHSR